MAVSPHRPLSNHTTRHRKPYSSSSGPYPKIPCTQTVYTLARKSRDIGILGPKYIPFGHMYPNSIYFDSKDPI